MLLEWGCLWLMYWLDAVGMKLAVSVPGLTDVGMEVTQMGTEVWGKKWSTPYLVPVVLKKKNEM
jgi:hypothetical protein